MARRGSFLNWLHHLYTVCGGPEKTGCKAVLKFGDYKVHSANPYCLNCYEVVSIIPIRKFRLTTMLLLYKLNCPSDFIAFSPFYCLISVNILRYIYEYMN